LIPDLTQTLNAAVVQLHDAGCGNLEQLPSGSRSYGDRVAAANR
jgi:hypothetical protein